MAIGLRGATRGVIQRRGAAGPQPAPQPAAVERPVATLVARGGHSTVETVVRDTPPELDSEWQQKFKRTLRRIAIWSVVGSIAVHLILGALSAVVIGQRILLVIVDPPDTEPEVTLVFPEQRTPEEEREQTERFIQTAQSTSQESAPEKADFISDKNTVASAISAPDPGGDASVPSMKGTDTVGLELADNKGQAGELMQSPTPATPQTMAAPPPPPQQAMPRPEAQKQEIAKNEETDIERIMRELDSATALLEERARPPDSPPTMAQNTPPESQSPQAAQESAPAVQSYMPETRMRTVKGGVAKLGDQNAVNAAKTIAGDYYQHVHNIIGQRWTKEVEIRNVQLLPGRIAVRFLIARDGSVRKQDIRVVQDEGGPFLKETAFTAILETKLPPLPAEMEPVLVDGRYELVVNFVTN